MPDESEPEPEPNFEQALGQLERIVANLERGEPELTAALAQYEKGVSLLRQCHRLLDQAEQSVALLTGVDEQGNPVTSPFDATATFNREASSPAPDNPDVPATPSTKRKSSVRPSTAKSPPPTVAEPISDNDPPF
jgi:exodeoxyribonuclease VII small subunit